MIDNVAHFFLIFSHHTIILPIVIIGYIWIDRKIFCNAIYLLLLSILFNYSLKITFKIPLALSIGKQGFAFPSGHMQTAIVLYGWIINFYKSLLLKIFVIILLCGIGYSLTYFGYHNYSDIFGAIFFGALLIYIFKFITLKNEKILKLSVIIFSTFLMLYIFYTYTLDKRLWIIYIALTSVVFTEKHINIKGVKSKILVTILTFIIIFFLNKLFSTATNMV